MANFVIEDGLPLPPSRNNHNNQAAAELRDALTSLKIGQSFLIYGERERQRARDIIKREHLTGIQKYTMRKQYNEEAGFYRIWRTE